MKRTTIAVCFRSGTSDILKVWLNSVFKYTKVPVRVCVVVSDEQSFIEAMECCIPYQPIHDVMVTEMTIPEVSVSRRHGAMLDAFVKEDFVSTEFLLTMDSDCFPVADGWLEDLERMLDEGARLAGILHPWAPPPKDMAKSLIEWRIRSQHCWDTTHVACQILRWEDLKELNVHFGKGDDTGLLIPLEAKKRGWKISGFYPTRCAKPSDSYDPEFNRYVCLIFGNKVYHHGGFTRIVCDGDKPMMKDSYDWVLPEIIVNGTASFLLEDSKSYVYKFDREESVAKDKMDLLFGMKTMK